MSYDSNLDRLTVTDLRAIAADLSIAGRSKMKRAELVAAITEAEAVNAAAAEHENEQFHSVNEVAILVDAPGRAVATAAFNGTTVGGDITRVRGRWVLSYRSGTGRSTLRSTIRAKTLSKVAKQWAKALGFHATAIDIDTMN